MSTKASESSRGSDAELGRMFRQVMKLGGYVNTGVRSYDRDTKPHLQAAIEGLRPLESAVDYSQLFYHDQFTPPELQVANLRLWNQELGLSFEDEQISTMLRLIPAFSWDQPLVPLTLCWTEGDLPLTVGAKLSVMRRVYGENKLTASSYLDDLDLAECLYLPDGAPSFEPYRVWWEVMDLDANRDKAPYDVPAEIAAGTQVFDVACQHPVYFNRCRTCLDVPGLRVRGSEPWVPCIQSLSDGRVDVHIGWVSSADSDYAEPVILRGL